MILNPTNFMFPEDYNLTRALADIETESWGSFRMLASLLIYARRVPAFRWIKDRAGITSVWQRLYARVRVWTIVPTIVKGTWCREDAPVAVLISCLPAGLELNRGVERNFRYGTIWYLARQAFEAHKKRNEALRRD